MESSLKELLAGGYALQLCAFLAAALFFAMAGIRELRDERLDGLLFLALAAFFAAAHVFYLFQLPAGTPLAGIVNNGELWKWPAFLLAPVLISLYILLGLFSFARYRLRDGLLKLFFGLTLVCYLYMLGENWAIDVKGILALTWTFIWLDVELGTAQ